MPSTDDAFRNPPLRGRHATFARALAVGALVAAAVSGCSAVVIESRPYECEAFFAQSPSRLTTGQYRTFLYGGGVLVQPPPVTDADRSRNDWRWAWLACQTRQADPPPRML